LFLLANDASQIAIHFESLVCTTSRNSGRKQF
jgi:hypothetical protein